MNYAVLVLAATAIGAGYALQVERAAHANTKTAHAEYIANAERTVRELSERNRSTEQELAHAQEKHATEAAALRELADSNRAAGAATAVRLRDAARETAILAGQVCADTASAGVREAAANAARVLADLRERADERAGVLARAADDAHFAGAACERRYNEAREAVNAVK